RGGSDPLRVRCAGCGFSQQPGEGRHRGSANGGAAEDSERQREEAVGVEVNQRVRTLLERSNVVPAGEGVIDVSAWVGQYPFRGILRSSVADWKEAAASLRISRAIVSPFEAVFWENNLDAYERWADSLAGESQLEVWPVVRPGALH